MIKIDLKTPKERKKIIRTILETIVIISLIIIIFRALFSFSKYKNYDSDKANNTNGFISISYFGVGIEGDDTLISTKRLEEHLKVLYNEGYVTITQQDIQDFYQNGTPLPTKALFLMFEDGRRDTAIFAQKIIEKYNFKATMMSYAERISGTQSKFLDGRDLLGLQDSTYWELGTNGYRLSYINVFDKENKYLGELDSSEFNKISDRLGRRYNHYLMDYIRDEDGVPKETKNEMQDRITYDYDKINDIYVQELGYVPKTYALMHSNTGQFGNNDKVSSINQKYTKEMFSINFNREGDCYNTNQDNIYDLTRMQPQSYWYTNHLLMRIKNDTNSNVTFITGDQTKISDFEIIKGAAQYQDQKFIVTSEEDGSGIIRLKKTIDANNICFNVRLTGNIIGNQTIYLNASNDFNNYLSISIKDGKLEVVQRQNNIINKISDASVLKNNTIDSYIDIRALGDYRLTLKINSNKLSIWINDNLVVDNIKIEHMPKGDIYLMSSFSDGGWSQRNLSDHVYDGVFEDLYISEDENSNNILYDGRYTGLDRLIFKSKRLKNNIINWFIKYL